VGLRSAQYAEIIGYFVNPVVMRGDLSGSPTFGHLVGRVREEVSSALEHADYPLPLLVKQLKSGYPASPSAPFQVMFVFQNVHLLGEDGLGAFALGVDGGKLRVGDLSLESIGISHRAPQFDLTLMMCETEGELKVLFEYDSEIFDSSTIRRMGEHFRELLGNMVSSPDERIDRLGYLSKGEVWQLVSGWNEDRKEYVGRVRIEELFEEQVKKRPDAVVVEARGEQISYGELGRRSNQLSRYLRRKGAGRENLIGVCMGRGVGMIVAVLGILKSGAGYVGLDAGYPRQRLEMMVEDGQLELIICDEVVEGGVGWSGRAEIVRVDGEWGEIGREEDGEVEIAGGKKDLAYVIYTSGSTGRPKGVGIEHGSVVRLLRWGREKYSDEELRGVLFGTSICFDLSVFEIFMPLSWGGRVIVAENALELGEMEGKGVSLVNTVPSAMSELVRMKGIPSGVKVVNLAGEALRKELAEEVYRECGVERVVNLYGPSEDTTYSTYEEVERGGEREVTIGRGITNTQVYVLDWGMEVAGIGIVGEIYIGGGGLGRGYLRRAELTAERFVPDEFSGAEGGRLYGTGDIGRVLGDGRIEYLGRRDHQVKVRGYRIELGEIEAVIRGYVGVSECVVVARELEQRKDKEIVAYVVVENGEEIGSKEIRDYVRGRAPEYMAPVGVVMLDRMPLTPNGKIDRTALPQPDQQSKTAQHQAPRTATQEVLAGIYEDTLKLSSVGAEDNFFELGGHSLLATQVISRIRDVFSVELALGTIFEAPTVSELATHVERARGTGADQTVTAIRPRQGRAAARLSYAQQRLWFIDRMQPGTSAYNIEIGLKLDGFLSAAALEGSLNEVVRRHEALRTVIKSDGGDPVQEVHPYRLMTLDVVDTSGLDDDDRARTRRLLIQEEGSRGFDLSSGPLRRWRLITEGSARHVLVTVLHHIISDGWSTRVLMEEVSRTYESYRRGEKTGLAELNLQYPDYAEWQRNRLQGEVLETQLAYWSKHFQDAPVMLDLPTDRPRPAALSYEGSSRRAEVPGELTGSIRSLSRGCGATLFMVMMSAFKALLSRYSGQRDIVVGTPIAGRNRGDIEGLIGLFVNSLGIRTEVNGEESFRDLVTRVRDASLGAYEHQEVPFEKLVEHMQVERALNHTPIFQVMFSLQNDQRNELRMSGLDLSFLEMESQTAKFDLTLSMIESADRLQGVMEYRTDLYEPATIERMLGHFQNLLEAGVANPRQRLSELTLLGESERQQLLVAWNSTAAEFSAELRIHDLFESQVQHTPDRVAAGYDGRQVTYSELGRSAGEFAKYLRGLGVGPETLVGICVERSLEMIVAVFAVLKAGGAYVPIDPAFPRQRIGMIVEDARPRVILTQTTLASMFDGPEVGAIICIDSKGDRERIADGGKEPVVGADANTNNLAYVIFTSGSTGRPKGVQVTHRSVVNFLQAMAQRPGIDEQDRLLSVTTLSFDIAGLEIFLPLITGARLMIVSREVAADAVRLQREIKASDATIMQATPARWRMLLGTGWRANKGLKVLCGGEALGVELAEQLCEGSGSIWNMYGPTETTIWSAVDRIDVGDKRVSIGSPIDNTTLYILDANQQPVAIGIPGELVIGGHGLARGYLNRAGLTAERFQANPFAVTAGDRLYNTGDLVRRLSDGRIEFLGRIDQQVKIRGFRIELGEIEAALKEQEWVKEAVVVAREDPGKEKRLVGYVVCNDAQPREKELIGHLREKLPEYMAPSVIVKLDRMPLTPNGKVDRGKLPAPDASRSQVKAAYIEPRTETEQTIAAVWQDVLSIDKVGINDNFFDIGGNSLLLVKVQSKLGKALSRDILVVEMFKYPTIISLARFLNQGSNDGARSRRVADRAEKRREALSRQRASGGSREE
jgi:amino acid adenylation domain-containing protein